MAGMTSSGGGRIIWAWRGREVSAAVRRNVATGLRTALRKVRDDIRSDLSGPSPSAVGSPPGKVSGALINSIGYRVSGGGTSGSVSGTVGVQGDGVQFAKGARLAGGFHGRDRLGRKYDQGPRPFVVPAVERNASTITEHVARGGI